MSLVPTLHNAITSPLGWPANGGEGMYSAMTTYFRGYNWQGV
jgi:hypothetical protein